MHDFSHSLWELNEKVGVSKKKVNACPCRACMVSICHNHTVTNRTVACNGRRLSFDVLQQWPLSMLDMLYRNTVDSR